MTFQFTAPVWKWQGEAAWYFMNIPKDYSDAIKEMNADTRRGFGSIRVQVTIGSTSWDTSIFPDSKSGCYLLPVKRSVRASEDLTEHSTATVELNVLVN